MCTTPHHHAKAATHAKPKPHKTAHHHAKAARPVATHCKTKHKAHHHHVHHHKRRK